jgi:hypothetical protein
MTIRYTLSRLSRSDARRVFGRTWFAVCAIGAIVSVVVFGMRNAFFIVTIWLLCVFAPVRIAAEILHSAGPRLRHGLSQDVQRRADRYATVEQITIMVEDLFGREVQMPRLAPPDLSLKVVEAAVRLCERAFRGGGGSLGVLRTITTCTALLSRWVGAVAAGEHAVPPAAPSPLTSGAGAETGNGAASPALWNPHTSIQDQWITLRAIAGLAALTRTLAAVYEDSADQPMEGGAAVRAATDAAMDYADQVGLRLDGPAWEDTAGVPRARLTTELTARLAETWTAYCAAPQPAPRRLAAFVEAVPE